MEGLITYLTAYALYAAILGLLFTLLFIHEPRGRLQRFAVLAVGLLALAVPIGLVGIALGYPDPWPRSGKFRLLGWHVQEADDSIFVFVDQPDQSVPRHLRLPFSRQSALELQQAAEHLGTFKEMSIVIAAGSKRSEPTYELTFKKVFDDNSND